jgi:hypothetical protein
MIELHYPKVGRRRRVHDLISSGMDTPDRVPSALKDLAEHLLLLQAATNVEPL